MTDITPLDAAHAAMAAAPDDDAARLRWWGEVAGSMLYLVLDGDGEDGVPRLVTAAGTDYVLAFDTEERLAAFAEGPVARAEMPGRAVAEWLGGQTGAGLALNLGAPSGQLLSPAALAWLAAMLAATGAGAGAEVPTTLAPPGPLPPALLPALERALARAAGLAAGALLAGARWPDGRRGLVLAVIGAEAGAETALARALSEALAFAGLAGDDAPALAFAPAGSALAARLARVGLRFEMPPPPPPPLATAAAATPPAASGSDPARPPRLR